MDPSRLAEMESLLEVDELVEPGELVLNHDEPPPPPPPPDVDAMDVDGQEDEQHAPRLRDSQRRPRPDGGDGEQDVDDDDEARARGKRARVQASTSTAKVVYPPYLILKGLPRLRGMDGKWYVPDDAGNPAITKAMSAFQADLANTAKVVYTYDGAFGEGAYGMAIARFKEYKAAEAASRAFEAEGRGKKEWKAFMLPGGGARGQAMGLDDKAELFGWLAEEEDMDELPRQRKKCPFKYTMKPYDEILNENREQWEQLEAMQTKIEEEQQKAHRMKQQVEKVQKMDAEFVRRAKELDEEQEEVNATRRMIDEKRKALENEEKERYRKAEAEHANKVANLDAEVAEVMKKKEKTAMDLKCIFENENKKIIFQKRIDERREGMKKLNELLIQQKQKLKEQQDKQLEIQMNMKDKQTSLQQQKQRLQSMQEKHKKLEEEEAKMLAEEKAAKSKTTMQELLKGLGEKLNKDDCCLMCMTEDFENPPPRPGDEGYAEKRLDARQMLIPCGHMNLCGRCCDLIKADAEEKNKPFLCPTCKTEVKNYMVLLMKF